MKYLFIALTMMIGILLPKDVLSDESKLWFKEDTLLALMICRTEEAIMEVMGADTISEEEVMRKIYQLVIMEQCAKLPRPLPFLVDSILVNYVDFSGLDSVVLVIKPAGSNIDYKAYSIAAGRGGTKKEKEKREQKEMMENSVFNNRKEVNKRYSI